MNAVPRRTVVCLGLSQLVCWGISYYLIGAFGDLMVADFGWSQTVVYGGLSAALLFMGVLSPLSGRLIDRNGGRRVMVAGSAVTFLGCVALALCYDVATYYAAWLGLGLGMRLTLYDAAFAALARIGGPYAKGPISQITLLGGLASTVFWPIGYFLAGQFGWRGTVLVYAGIALLTIPLHLAIPDGSQKYSSNESSHVDPVLRGTRRDQYLAGGLYAVIVMLTTFLASGMSAHMIAILTNIGLAASLAVWISTLRGIGQSLARLCEVLSGSRLHPLGLALLAAGVLPICFLAGRLSGELVIAAVAFALLYGVGNGLMTIVRGTLPLILFDHHAYGTTVGRLLVPSFFLSAAAPVVYAFVIERWGSPATFYFSAAIAAVVLGATIILSVRFGSSRPA